MCVHACVLPLFVGATGLGGKTEEAPNTNKRVRLSLCLSRAPDLALWDSRERLNNWKISLPHIPERSLCFFLSLRSSLSIFCLHNEILFSFCLLKETISLLGLRVCVRALGVERIWRIYISLCKLCIQMAECRSAREEE